jgi:uncharacterized protein
VSFSGEADASDLPRLAEAVDTLARGDESGAAANWPVRYSLLFQRDDAGRSIVTGTCELVIRPIRQRCLGRVDLDLRGELRLALIGSESEADDLPEDLDPAVVEDDRLRPLDLVEEELLLALPLVPMHPVGDCGSETLDRLHAGGASASDQASDEASEKDNGPTRENPFAVLATLKKPADDG